MPTRSPLRLALTVALTVCLVLGAIPQAVAATPPGRGSSQMLAAPPAEATVVEFKHTGQSQSWQVPAGVTSIRVDVQGAQGGGVYGGFGARVQATLPVRPGQQLQVNVGGRGLGVNGGFNGGGNAGLGGRGVGGGGASDIRVAPYALADRLVVAGGGGGAAPAATSIFGVGGSAGRNGQAGGDGSEDGQKGGGGGTQTQGGTGGDYAEPGRLGQGGKSGYKAGAGGGGYYGGGGGVGGTTGDGGGGGAGSSSVTPEATWARFLKGAHVGDGAIAITYPATTASASPRQPVSSSAFEFTGSATLWRVPAGVRSIRVDAFGAQGAGIDETPASYGGFGARVRAIVEVEPEQLLTVLVGGKGNKATGGFNGGGDGKLGWARGLAGGGASDVRAGGWRLEDRLVVAGGGGGAAPDAGPIFGVGGSAGDVGQGGGDSRSSKGGGGGSQAEGGAGGDYAEAGRLGQGGEGGYNAGGGGGGFYGGGGGSSGVSAGGGGGAGSSYVTPSASWSRFLKGAHVGDGTITIRAPDRQSGGPGSPLPSIEEFKFTGKAAVHQVPEGSKFMGVDVRGAAGAEVGGVTVAAMRVKAGQQLAVVVGGKANRSTGGFNGGGSGVARSTSGGGGASDVRAGGWRLEDRIAVAGGGGGTGRPGVVGGKPVLPGPGGPGGGPFGLWGGSGFPVPAPGGGGGTQRGPGPSFDPVGTPAGLGYGASAYFGGAGGGGYYGGGSGSPNLVLSSGSTGGGGGGSGFYTGRGIPVSLGYNPGNGSVKLLLPTGGDLQKTIELVRERLELPAPRSVAPGRAT